MNKALIIIPTYNEADNILELIPRIFDFTANNEFQVEYHVLVVDDNSPDDTARKVEAFGDRYPVNVLRREKKMGLGTAYMAGFQWALERDYQYVYEMDADWSHHPKYLLSFIREMREKDAYCVIGSRFYKWRVSVVNWHLKRLMLSLTGHRYTRLVLGNMGIYDTTSGFKCFRREALEALNLKNIRSNGYVFQLELNFRLFKKKLKISEIPIIFKDRDQGQSKMSPFIVVEAIMLPIKLKLLSVFKGGNF